MEDPAPAQQHQKPPPPLYLRSWGIQADVYPHGRHVPKIKKVAWVLYQMLAGDGSTTHSHESLWEKLSCYEAKEYFATSHSNYMSKLRALNIIKGVKSRNGTFQFEDDALVKLRVYLRL